MEHPLPGFAEFPVLRTPRLLLREIRPDDAQAIFAMRANGRVNQFIARPAMTDLEAAESLVARTRAAYGEGKAIGWAGILRDGGTIIGTCGFNTIEPHNLHAEIGGEMATEYWGKGIALEAVQAILRHGIEVMGLHTIEAKVNPDNRGAIAVLERLGFQKEAHYRQRIRLQAQYWDMAVYTLLSGEQRW